MITCSVKIGEELSAAAITRGLGAPVKRTNICQLKFNFADVVLKIIVFDEPTSGLDLKHMREVARSLKSLADQGKTLLVITHDPELVMAGCSYVVHMEKGQIKESYPLDESGSKKVLDFSESASEF